MGDRCYVGVHVRECDAERFKDIMGSEEEINEGKVVFLGASECNYSLGISVGCSGELPDDVPYYGSHGSGDEYGAGEFACDGKEFRYAEVGADTYAIRFDEKTGEPSQDDIVDVKAFILFRNRVKEMLDQPNSTIQESNDTSVDVPAQVKI